MGEEDGWSQEKKKEYENKKRKRKDIRTHEETGGKKSGTRFAQIDAPWIQATVTLTLTPGRLVRIKR